MENFTPVSAFAGGLLIGGAATLFIVLNGRVAGISGVLGGVLDGLFGATAKELPWRVAFVRGILLGPLVVVLLGGTLPNVDLSASLPVIIVSGVLVGFGTRLGGGCTSGHGVCGLARGSRRSIVATAVFFTVAAVTVFVMRHLVGG